MRIKTSLMTLAGVVAGAVVAVVVYQSMAGASAVSRPTRSSSTGSTAEATTTWLPCAKGWKLKGETCTRVKERVVVVGEPQAAPRPNTAPRGSAPIGQSYSAPVPVPASIHTGATPTPTPVPHGVEVEHPESAGSGGGD